MAWLAVLALLWAAVVPAAVHARGAIAGDPWAEVCTAQGVKRLPAGEGADAGASLASPVCGVCVVAAVGLGVPGAPGTNLPAIGPGATASRAMAEPGVGVAHWTVQSRAPPRVG